MGLYAKVWTNKFKSQIEWFSTGILKVWGGHGPPAPTRGTPGVAPVLCKAQGGTQHPEHALLTTLGVTQNHTPTEPWLATLYLYTETTNWECTGFPTFTKCHFRSIQQQPWMQWAQVLLSSPQLLEPGPALSCASTAVHALQTESSKGQGTGSKHTEIMWFAVKETKLYWEAFLSFQKNESITHSTLVKLKGSNNKGQNLILIIELFK